MLIVGAIGGIDLGLIGTLIVYGGIAAFALLRRDMPSGQEFAACAPAIALQSS